MKHYLLLIICIGMFSFPSLASTVKIEYNSSSGIQDAEYTYKQSDGTVLGFYLGWEEAYFMGAISSKSSITIPDNVQYDSKTYPVKYIGGWDLCDFDNASTVTSLTLPTTAEQIRNLPLCVKVLHTKNFISSIDHEFASNLDKVLVPSEHLQSYYDATNWSNYVLINAEGANPSKITINMTKEGEFAQLLLQKTDNWYKVNELTVVGNLNENDLNVFKRMRQLTKLDLSKAIITDIPNQFDGASSYSEYRDGFNILEELSLPEINSIGDYAFAQCYRLKNIKMTKVKTIGYGAFSNCGASQIKLPEGLSTIRSYAFYQSKLKSVIIPSSISEISDGCFEYCGELSSITIPSSVTTIKDNSFYESGLTSITLPGVQTIGYYAFYNCKQLAKVQFAESLVSIDVNSFDGCTGLTEIDLPSSLISTKSAAFANCTNIKKVISRAVCPPTHESGYFILQGCDMTDVKLYVPSMSIDNYRENYGWNNFYTILPLNEKLSNAYIWNDATIDDTSIFSPNCNLTLDWFIYEHGIDRSSGSVDCNGTLSMHQYEQRHYLGNSDWDDNYSSNAQHTSLISNGSIRADLVTTKLTTENTWTWYFISFPYDVNVSDITYPEGVHFAIRKYSGANRASMAGDTWVNLTDKDVMNAYEGYILRCDKENVEFTFPAINNGNKNKIFEKDNAIVPLNDYVSEFEHNRSWNLIGNPYPCYFDSRFIDFTAPITVWNRYEDRYDAYSPLDDEFILHPVQAFFVQKPIDKSNITFYKEGRQKTSEAKILNVKSRTKVNNINNRSVYNLYLSQDNYRKDKTRFVINEQASNEYELDKDASKFIDSNNSSLLLYTIQNGLKYAINERPFGEGIVNLGVFAPEDGRFTFSISAPSEKDIVLVDNENNITTLLNEDYTCNIKAGYNDKRFQIILDSTTAINSIDNNSDEIIIVNGEISSNMPFSIYSFDGRLIGNYFPGSVCNLSKGVYVINSKDVKRKVVVK